MRKKSLLIWGIGLSIVLGSCADTQFATTKRTFKNGHYVYVNKKEKKIRKVKTVTATKNNPKNVSASNGHSPQPNGTGLGPAENLNPLAGKEISPELFVYLFTENLKAAGIVRTDESSQPAESGPVSPSASKKRSKSSIKGNDKFQQKDNRPRHSPDTVYVKKEQPNVFTKKRNAAVGGMVVGIIGIIIAGIILGTIALVSGISGLRKIKKYPNKYKGRGFAIASIILGVIDIIGAIVAVVVLLNSRS